MCNVTEKLWCESCGESEQEISMREAGLCGDCFARDISEIIEAATGDKFCGRPLFVAGKLAGICAVPHGVEHAHGTIEGLAL